MKPNALCFFQVAAITFAALTGIQSSSAQMPIDANGLVDAYERGEGVVFHNRATGYSLQFRGLAQFTSETRHFSETDEWTTRFRARRIRMRWAGASSSQKFRYRVQYELSNPDGDGDDVSGMLMDAWCAYQPNNRFRIRRTRALAPIGTVSLVWRVQASRPRA